MLIADQHETRRREPSLLLGGTYGWEEAVLPCPWWTLGPACHVSRPVPPECLRGSRGGLTCL